MTITAPARPAVPPRAPGALPLLGHWPRFGSRPHEFLATLPAHGSVVRIRIPGYDTYVVTDPDLVREALVSLSDQGMMIERAEALLGEGVTVLRGARHRRERRMIAPAFAKARIATYAEVMTRFGAERAESWHDGQFLAVDAQMHDLALRTVAGALFTGELGAETAERIHTLLPPVMTLLSRRVTRPAWIDRLPLPGNRRFAWLVRELQAATGSIIAAYRADMVADANFEHDDLLGTLLTARDPDSGTGLSDKQVHDELINFLVGGTEAIGVTTAWTFHELGRNPSVEAALHAEVDRLGGRPATFADLPDLVFTKRVVLETLRRYSPWLTVRHVDRPYRLGDYEIPSNSMLFVCPVAIHRDAGNHAEPERFDPDRWTPQRAESLSKGAHIPFGMGARQCPGNVFALTQITLQVATIAARWRLRPIPGVPVGETVIGALVHPDRLPMRAEARRPSP